MANPYIVGLIAGLASGLMSSLALTGSPAFKLLIYLAPLPSFIAGFGWRLNGSVAAAVSGTALILVLVGSKGALGFFLTIGLPTTILCYLAYLSRSDGPVNAVVVQPGDRNQPPHHATTEWFPVGHLMFWAAIIAGFLAIFVILSMGGTFEAYKSTVKTLFDENIVKQLEALSGQKISATEASTLSEIAVSILPGASALTWLALTLFNMWLGARITLAMGRLQRPWPHIPALEYPNTLSFSFVAAIILTFMAGLPLLFGIAFLSAFVFLYILLGFAVLHTLTEGNPYRALMLPFAYAIFIFTGQYGIMVMATLGLAEPLFRLRQRIKRPPPPTSGPPP